MSTFQYRIRTLIQYKDLIKELVGRDLKLKYRRSFLGYVWSVLNPLLIMIVMTVVFSAMFKKNIENYPVYLLIGRMTFDFLTNSTNTAMRSVTGNAALLKKTYIPKYIFTLSKVTSGLVDFILSLGALLIVMVATRSSFHWQMIMIPLVLIQLYVFCLGLGFLLASLNVFFRDIQYIYKAVTTAWMYLTPIFYPLEQLPGALQLLIKVFNPMYYYVSQFRDMVLYGRIPGPRIFWGGWFIAFLMLLIGVWCFQKQKDKFILYI
ncbi:MAG: ABC transporter permease [Lachnospiraceae bacterium]|nr:ABC transporter permease [Lachnospiraceae bacterium]MDD3796428.1 ABC transporter permease [Lachnospiraceae bacterium]